MYLASSKLHEKANKRDWKTFRQKLLRRKIGKATSDVLLSFKQRLTNYTL